MHDVNLSDGAYVDLARIAIERAEYTDDHADYLFACDVYESDPRFPRRLRVVGQTRGPFRIERAPLTATLLRPMEGDPDGHAFVRASSKIRSLYVASGQFPERATFAAG
jgi:hypothetical protein